MRILIVTLILALALTSCGGTSGGRFTPDLSGYPALMGTFTFTFEASSDPAEVMGRVPDLHEPYVLHLHTTSSGADITAYDDFGRVWDGGFSDTDGTFMLTTGDEFQHKTMEISVTGTLDADDGDGQFSLTLLEGYGDDDGAVVTGVWEAEIV